GIGGIPDKNFNVMTNGKYEHRFIYVPIEGPDGRTWLNNNLGADYANVNSPHFNPTQQATSKTDYKAYGSMFQWQRKPDGHELYTWTSGTSAPTPKYSGTHARVNSWTNPNTNQFIPSSGSTWSWNYTGQGPWDLWQSGKSNNPCPQGYHVPTKEEWQTLHQAIAGSTSSVSNNKMWSETSLSLPASGYRNYDASFNYQGSYGYYWSSSQYYSKNAWYMNFGSGYSNPSTNGDQAGGFSVRCLKD
ncbi:FISUMP domain-containing protein, partial [Ornithobacterium rhinotracheale]